MIVVSCVRRLFEMPKIIEKDTEELIDLQRFVHILLSLTPSEVETLEILIDKDALSTISKSIREFERGDGILIDEW